MKLPKARWKRITLGLLAVILVSVGVFLITPMGQDVVRIARFTPALSSAKVADTELFTPQVVIGEQCTPVPLAAAAAEPSETLTTAIDEAKAYSDSMQGVGLIVMQNGELLHESYTGDGGADQWTRSFSMHKSLVSLAVGRAIEKGAIGSLDEPVSTYITEWEGEPRGAITLKQLLHMESGLELIGPSNLTGLRLILGNDITSVILDRDLAKEPGSEFEYNNTSSQVLGIALDRALQEAGLGSYPDFVEANIWCPAGNGEAAFWFDNEEGSARYHSGMFTDLASWARIGELIRNNGAVGGEQIVPADWIAAMQEPAPTNPNYGLHIWLGAPEDGSREYNSTNPLFVAHSEPYLADDVIFFDGFGGQRVYIVPSAGLTIARSGEVNFEYDDAVIVNSILAALQEGEPEG